MSTNTQLKPVRRSKWCDLIDRTFAAESEPPVRREARRYSVEFGEVRMVFVLEDENGDPTGPQAISTPLMQVASDGLMVRGHREIPIGTQMAMEVAFEGVEVVLLGKIAHCTNTVGGYKIGISLEFPED